MENLEMYVGTKSDETIIDELVKIGFSADEAKRRIELSEIKDCFVFYFATNILEAKSQAKKMGLKNFSEIGKTYTAGEDY